MKFPYPYLLLILSISSLAQAETWTSTDGQTLEGEFVNYDINDGIIVIRRTSDDKTFDIPEQRLIHADCLKAVQLENKRVEPYWYSEYPVAKEESPFSRCLLLVTNGSDPEAFELLCYKLLLNERFQKQLDDRDFIVCAQAEIPEEIAYLRIRRNGEDWKMERLDVIYPETPLALITDFRRDRNDGSITTRLLQNWRSLSAKDAFNELAKDIRRYKKRDTRERRD
jgi:hypothetical protein